MIKRKRRFLWLFRRASFYFIYFNLRSTFDRKPTDLEQVKGHALHAALVLSSTFLLTFTNKRSCFLLTAVGHLYTRLSLVSFWGEKETGTEMGRGRKVRNKYEVCDQCDQVLRVRIEEWWWRRMYGEENYTFITHIHFKCSDIEGCTLDLSGRTRWGLQRWHQLPQQIVSDVIEF